MLEHFFNCEDNCVTFKDDDVCQAWAKDKLINLRFIFAVVNNVSIILHFHPVSSTLSQDDDSMNTSLMCHPFILQVFATHLNSIVGAEDVPGFGVTDKCTGASVVAKYPPKGALALAATAVSSSISTHR
jgi:hypothetical protein